MKRVLISGGGIGGLALAIALARAGWRPLVVERAPQWAPLGAGLILGPHAVAVCRALGLTDRLPHHTVERLEIHDGAGRCLGQTDATYWNVHRADLHATLLEAAEPLAEIRLGTTVTAVDSARATLSDGRTESADLIVGADGIRSGLRALLAPDVQPRYAGYTCWRLVGPRTLPGDRIIERWAPGLRLGSVPLTDGRIYVFACANAPAGQRDGADPWGELIARFAPMGPDVAAQLSAARGTPLLRHDIEELPAPCWGTGRVTLLGDAAHAMTPNTGSGAAMALEDALALGLCLHAADSVEQGLAAYRQRRHARVVSAARTARQIGQIGQWSWPWACWLRDRLMAATPASVQAQQMAALLAPGLALAEQAQRAWHRLPDRAEAEEPIRPR